MGREGFLAEKVQVSGCREGGAGEEGNPAGLSSCSGGLRPLVELCVEPAGLCGRCTGVAGISGLHSRLPRGVMPRLEGKPRTPLSSRVATRVSWSPLRLAGLALVAEPFLVGCLLYLALLGGKGRNRNQGQTQLGPLLCPRLVLAPCWLPQVFTEFLMRWDWVWVARTFPNALKDSECK